MKAGIAVCVASVVAFAPAGHAEQPMTNAEAAGICQEVAALDSRGEIERILLPEGEVKAVSIHEESELHRRVEVVGQIEKRFSLELEPGRPQDFGRVMSRGTCVSFSVEPLHSIDPAENAKWPETDSLDAAEDELRLIGWGSSESVLRLRGRHFVATQGGHGIDYLEWLTPASTRRGLCTFEDAGVERSVSRKLAPDVDCEALARVTPVATPSLVDLDNDGTLDSIGFEDTHSGAGCGHSSSTIHLLGENDQREKSPRNEALAGLVGLENGPVMILTLAGEEYLYAAGEAEAPTAYRVTRTGVVPLCEFRLQYARRVKTQFRFRN